MEKDFDSWNKSKKALNALPITKHVYPREVWWCSLGLNIGVEIDGKNENFERPVVLMKVYNKESLVMLPLTSKPRNDSFHHRTTVGKRIEYAKLTQMRVISSKRLMRRIGRLTEEEFKILKDAWIASL